MYDTHFGLTGRPFDPKPDPAFWFGLASHRKALTYLGYGLAQGEGFMVVTGDGGVGKTTLAAHLLEANDRTRLHAIKLDAAAIDADDLLRILAAGLDVRPAGLAKAQLLAAIEQGLHGASRTGRRTLLVVDEAQLLSVLQLEDLLMLSSLQAGGHALLQILLLGRPEFRDRLYGSDRLEQLCRRVIACHHLDPMEPDEVADYIAYRLQLAGWHGLPDFADDAFPKLHAGSGGVPRQLNLLLEQVMLHASTQGLELIDAGVVEAVIGDVQADLPCRRHAGLVPASTAPREQAAEAAAEPWMPEQVRHDGIARSDSPAEEPPTAPDVLIAARLAALEARMEEQDAALRRVLTLLVDWVEADAARAASGSARGHGTARRTASA